MDSKLAIKSRKYQSHKKSLRDESSKRTLQDKARAATISNIGDRFAQDEKALEEIIKLQEKHEWEKIDKQLELKLERDHENVDTWIKKGENFDNWEKYQDAIHCFKNALIFDKQVNSDDKKNYEIYLKLAGTYYEIKDYQEAEKNCKESLKIKPDNFSALIQLGYIYRDIPNYEYSKIYFEKVLEQKSKNVDVLDNLGWLAEESKEWDKAIEYYEESRKVKDDEDDDIWADIRMAACYLEKKDFEHAELLINKERVRKNETKYSYKVRGDICKFSKKFKEAIENYEKEFEWFNVREDVWFDLGFCNQQNNNLELSINYYKKYIEISGLRPTTAQNLGNAYRDLKQYEDSENTYNLGIAEFPGTVAILENKVILHIRQSQYDEAIKCCDEIIEIEPDIWAMRQKGMCLGEKGEHDEAIKIFEEIQETIAQGTVSPTTLERDGIFEEDLLNSIGWEWIMKGENQKGLDFVEQALEINSKKWYIIDSKAVALKNLGRFKEAKEWYEKVFEITKEEEDEIEIATCHRRMGNNSNEDEKEKHNIESIKIFDSILEKNNSNSDAHYQKALCYWNLKQYEESKKCIEKAIKINPNKMEYWYELGEIAIVEKKFIQAIFYMDKCIKLKPTTDNYKAKADALFDLEKYEEAIKNYNIAIDIYDKNKVLFPFGFKEKIILRIWNNIANTYGQLKKYQDAIEYYNKSLNEDEENHITLSNKGNTLRKMKEYDDAMECLNHALKILPRYYHAQNVKIQTYIDWKKYDDAKKLAKDVEGQHPDQVVETTKLLIKIYKETGETSKQKENEKKLQELRDLKNNKTDGI
ncbi:tetratricopeptide repeat protein [Nitrosopumilus sp.]|nr:tetratricopeptide repeat protein [Nitrosopumilus sp.]MDB4839879.1 tetratricopeptide repeat protein [Nitrosopumilus sp.]